MGIALIDPLCEKAIREKIGKDFPDHGILGEEEVEPGIQASIDALEEKLAESDWLWIIDPVRCSEIHDFDCWNEFSEKLTLES